MTPREQLYAEITKVCPISACNADGTLVYTGATEDQVLAAEAVLAEYDLQVESWKPTSAIGRAYRALERNAAIDARSQTLIAKGLNVNHGSPISLSANAQITLMQISMASGMGLVTFPLDISRLDGTAYAITDAADLGRIARMMTARIKSVLDAGRALRIAILHAATIAEIDAVVDDRE